MKITILCIEGKHSGTPAFTDSLKKKGYEVRRTLTGKEALEKLEDITPHVAVINAPSMRTTGVRICKSLHDSNNNLPIILISEEGQPRPEDTLANIVLSLPFTIRKLDNRIRPFLPIESDRVLQAGPIYLDKDNLLLRCQGKETHLTPKMSSLLEMLMERPGEVIERDHLFCKVWETDFTDDTRTLDVHISWLRKAIEVDPRRPKFLKTLRGVGYRLDV